MATFNLRSSPAVWTGSIYAQDVDGLLTNALFLPTEPDNLPDQGWTAKMKRIIIFPIASTLTWKLRTGPIELFQNSDLLTEPAPAGYAMVSAVLQDTARVRVKFGVNITAVDPNGENDALNFRNYEVKRGGLYLSGFTVTYVAADTVDLTFSTPLINGSYNIRVHGVISLLGLFPNPIAAADTVTVVVPLVSPTVLVVVGSPDTHTVKVVYSKPMDRASATNPNNYTVSSGVAVLGVTWISDTIFLLTTAGESAGGSYTLTCSSAITDQAGNPLT